MKIKDSDVNRCSDNSWTVCSQTKNKIYTVQRLFEICPCKDFCFYRCPKVSCVSLCSHLYQCNCLDKLLCKHIHKVHSLLNRQNDCMFNPSGINLESNQKCNENMKSINNVSHYNPQSIEQRVNACEKFVEELLQLIRQPKVQNVMLKCVHTTLNSLVSECRGILNSDENSRA
ncbi:hypothetical protein X975_13684, partial [Stegodyphus mimosarum]